MKRSQSTSDPKRDIYLILGLLLLAGTSRSVLFYLIPDGQYNDDASFLLRGLNFAGVREAAALGNPIHFAPGWPLLLAPFLKFSEQWYTVGRVLSTLLTCVTACFLTISFTRKGYSRLFGAAVALLFLNAPQVMILGSSLMAEPLYICLAAFCLLAGKDIHREPILSRTDPGLCPINLQTWFSHYDATGCCSSCKHESSMTFDTSISYIILDVCKIEWFSM